MREKEMMHKGMRSVCVSMDECGGREKEGRKRERSE